MFFRCFFRLCRCFFRFLLENCCEWVRVLVSLLWVFLVVSSCCLRILVLLIRVKWVLSIDSLLS